MKKAEMSMQIIVIAVISLVVLAVLLFIFLRGSNTAADSLTSCETTGGTCVAQNECTNGVPTKAECPDENEPVCCVEPGNLLDRFNNDEEP